MTYTVANTALTNTLDYLRSRVNEVAFAMSTVAVTTNSNTATGNAAITGSFTANNFLAGNSTVNVAISGTTGGIVANSATLFFATVNTTFTVGNSTVNASSNSTYFRIGGSVNVGNSTVNATVNTTALVIANSTANIVLRAPTAAAITNGNYYLNANGTWVELATASTPISQASVATSGTSQQVIDSYALASYAGAEYMMQVKNNSANGYMATKLLTTHNIGVAYVTEYATISTNTSLGTFNAFTNSTHVIVSFTPTVASATVKFARVII